MAIHSEPAATRLAGERKNRLATVGWTLGAVAGAVLVLMGLYTAVVGFIPISEHRMLGVGLSAIAIVFGGYGMSTRSASAGAWGKAALVAGDVALVAVLLFAILHFRTVLNAIEYEFYTPSVLDVGIAFAGIAALLEIGRRIWGLPLILVALLFLAYLVFGHLLPSAFGHRDMAWPEVSSSLWYGYQGVFSTMMTAVLKTS